jgi:hydrogenase nickel incorporation protein HypA/HybF
VHEVGIAHNVLRIVELAARENGLRAVTEVVLSIGPLSGVEREALEFAFGVISPETVLQGAEIKIVVPPLLLQCRKCGNEYAAEIEDTSCPFCGAEDFEIREGRDMLVTSVSGEKAEADA